MQTWKLCYGSTPLSLCTRPAAPHRSNTSTRRCSKARTQILCFWCLVYHPTAWALYQSHPHNPLVWVSHYKLFQGQVTLSVAQILCNLYIHSVLWWQLPVVSLTALDQELINLVSYFPLISMPCYDLAHWGYCGQVGCSVHAWKSHRKQRDTKDHQYCGVCVSNPFHQFHGNGKSRDRLNIQDEYQDDLVRAHLCG